jgi:small multidrug resistance pump
MRGSWLLLAVAIALEVAGTVCMKASDGFRDLRASALMFGLYALSLTTLAFAFRRIDIAIGYAVGSGAGLILVVAIGMLWFREPATAGRLLLLLLILIGLVGLPLMDSGNNRTLP